MSGSGEFMSRPVHWLCFQPLIEHHLAGVWKETISDLARSTSMKAGGFQAKVWTIERAL